MRVTKLTYKMVGQKTTGKPWPDGISLEVEVSEGESVQEAIHRAKITCELGLGIKTPRQARALREVAGVMEQSAADLRAEAGTLELGGF